MKASIITCNNADNYGARLQAYALQHYLESLGHKVEVIDYEPDYMGFKSKLIYNPGLSIKEWAKLILRYPQRRSDIKKHSALEAFSNKYLHLTRKYHNINELRANPPKSSFYIAGSDQIWNTDFANGNDPAFYLDFGDTETKRISYAASFAIPSLPSDKKDFVKDKISRLDNITVREESAVNIVKDLGFDATLVCDPVFLLDEKFWSAFADDTGKGEKYLLVYDFECNDDLRNVAKRLAKENNLKIYSVSPRKMSYADKNFCDCSPETFVGLIKNASMVVSNSLHGSIFSMIFKRPFTVVLRADGLNTRMSELLNRHYPSTINSNDKIYTITNETPLGLTDLITKSQSILKQLL